MRATLTEVKEALEGEQMDPFFQPIVELRTGHLYGFEVLARWLHPLEGPILPENFIHLAESGALIERLTEQILNKAFVPASVIPTDLFLAVNVSPTELCGGQLSQKVRHAAARASFDLNRLIIEVTETVVIDDLKCAEATAHKLKAMGSG